MLQDCISISLSNMAAQDPIKATRDAFNKIGIAFKIDEVVEHKVVMTSDEHKVLPNLPQGALAKNLLLVDKKKHLWLVTIPEDRKIDLKLLAKQLVSTETCSHLKAFHLMNWFAEGYRWLSAVCWRR